MEHQHLDVSRLHPEMRRLCFEMVGAYRQRDRRRIADLSLAIVRAAPSPWAYGRYHFFQNYAKFLVGIANHSDKEAFPSFLSSSQEPALFRASAACGLAQFFAPDINDKELRADYYRQAIAIVEHMDRQDLDRPLVTPDNPSSTVRAEIREILSLSKGFLRVFENPYGLEANAAIAEVMGADHDVVRHHFNLSIEQHYPPELQSRLGIGGSACDCCGKSLEELGVTRLDCCKRCKMAYYCSTDCQRTQWKAGHKQACRKSDEIQPGDIMVVRGLVARPDLNGEVVRVKDRNGAMEGRWVVKLFRSASGQQQWFSIGGDKLFHIRPAA